ncbi:MAG TPA: hypothetical protein VJQ54_11790 [Candidatus Sulfotelmatobacter sp.]|nr:hypothetical protein [Candidatus Sulfotelmatobacter sp.]
MRVMTQHGKVSDYNETTGTGFLTPEKGGGPLPFRWADLQDQAQLPKQNDRYGYDTQSDHDGEICAVNLKKA